MSTDLTTSPEVDAVPSPAARPGRFGAGTLGVPPPTLEPEPVEPERRRRRWPWIVGAVVLALLLLAGVFLGGRAVGSRGQAEVWQLTVDLPAGAAVRATAVHRVVVSDEAARTGLSADVDPTGRIVGTNLRAGQLLPPDLVPGGTPLPRRNEVLVGVATLPGAVPDGLRAGDVVSVVRLPVTTSTNGAQPDLNSPGTPLLARVPVYSVVPSGQGAVVTIVVPALFTNTITALSAQNRIAFVTQPVTR